MLTIARIIVHAAMSRKGSVGAHYRSDFKERGEAWQRHFAWDRESLKNQGSGTSVPEERTCGRETVEGNDKLCEIPPAANE